MASRKKTKAEADAAYVTITKEDIAVRSERLAKAEQDHRAAHAGGTVSLEVMEEQFTTLELAISAGQAKLKDQHGIDVEADTLEQMKEQREDEVKADTRVRAQRQQKWNDEDVTREAEKAREAEQHQHDVAQRTQLAREELSTSILEAKRHERFREQDVERALDFKVDAVAAREVAVGDLEAKVAAFPDVMKAEVDKQLAVITNSIKQAHKHELALLAKDAASAQALAAEHMASQAGMIEDLRNQRNEAKVETAAARQQNAEIAMKSLDAGSQREALNAVEKANAVAATASPGRRN